ncbi:MAG: adenosylcobinamide-GDP ribazoletransferase [Archaeoglobaceae archaeon]
MKNLLSFFTRIPVSGDLESMGREVWLLPLLGIVTASISSVILYLDPPLRGMLAVLALYLVMGIIHLDGLGDFADGVMVKGDREGKIRALKDVNVGTAGIFALTSVLLLQVFSLNILPFWSILVAEVNSKMGMLAISAFSKPLGSGLGSHFMNSLNSKRLVLAVIVYLTVMGLLFVLYPKSIILVVSLVVPLLVGRMSMQNFGGVNGDCIGACAELTRVAGLVVLALILF